MTQVKQIEGATYQVWVRASYPDGDFQGHDHSKEFDTPKEAEAYGVELLKGSFGSLGLDTRYRQEVEVLTILEEGRVGLFRVVDVDTLGEITEGMEYVKAGEVVLEIPYQGPAKLYVVGKDTPLAEFTKTWDDMNQVIRFASTEEARAWEVPAGLHQRMQVCKLIDNL